MLFVKKDLLGIEKRQMKTGIRLQKKSLHCLTAGTLANYEQYVEVYSGMSRYEIDGQYHFIAQSTEDSGDVANFVKRFPHNNAVIHFFDHYDDIILPDEERQKH